MARTRRGYWQYLIVGCASETGNGLLAQHNGRRRDGPGGGRVSCAGGIT